MTSKAPTEDEVAAALAVLERDREEKTKAAEARLKPIRDLVASETFADFKKLVEDLPLEFTNGIDTAPQLMAIKSGLAGLERLMPAKS